MSPPAPPGVPRIGLPPEQLAAAFPFHFAVDGTLTILQAGSTLRRVCPDVRPGARLDEVLRPIRPEGRITHDWLLENKARFFLLEHPGSALQLRGEFVELPGEDTLLFLGSPWLTDSADITALGLGFEDFAIHDPVVDMLQLHQASKMALADAKKLAAKLTAQRAELRAANERLRQQEAEARKLALIAARTDNAVVLSDAGGLVLWVNEGFTRLTGYTLEDMLGRTAGSMLQGPGTDAATVRRISERLRRGEGFTEEILNYRRDGREYWAAIEVQPIRDDDGRIVNYMSIESDITARRAAQRRLGLQHEVSSALAGADDRSTTITRVLRIICEQLDWQVGQSWVTDGERLRFANCWHADEEPFAAFTEASRAMAFARGEGLPGRAWAAGAPCWIADVARDGNFPHASVAARCGLRGAFAFPVVVQGETRGVLEFYSREAAVPDDETRKTFEGVGAQIGSFIVRREAEEALRLSEERLRLALEGAQLGTWDLHMPSGAITVSDRYLAMLGYAPGERATNLDSRRQNIHPDDTRRVAEATRALLRGETEFYQTEHRLRHKSGAWVWVLARGRVIERDADGHPVRACGMAVDITERKAAEQELIRERRLLEAAQQRELETGHEIQRALLLGNPPTAVLGIEVASYTAPSQGIDGDFYAFTTFRPDCLELLVGDVMGKGVPAALVGAAVRTTYNEVVTELLAASHGSGVLPSPAAIMNALHARLTPRLIELDTFVTMALYRLDLTAGTMSHVNAGHTPGLVLGDAGAVTAVLGDNVPMGVQEDERYVEASVRITPGDALVVYSDGVTEARNAEGVEFGAERLESFLERAGRHALPAGICMQALRKAVRDFVGLQAIPDDQTAVMVRLRQPGGERRDDLDLPWDAAGLEPLRRRVAEAAAPLGEDAADRLVLAAFEAATNVVRHVARPFSDATLSCRIGRAADRVTVEIWYVGLPFVPGPEPLPDFSGESEGGFGLYIIEHAVSEVSYENPLLDVCCTRLVQIAGAGHRG